MYLESQMMVRGEGGRMAILVQSFIVRDQDRWRIYIRRDFKAMDGES